MEKYGTYRFFRHKETGEIKRYPEAEMRERGIEKTAELSEGWEELEEEPEDVQK